LPEIFSNPACSTLYWIGRRTTHANEGQIISHALTPDSAFKDSVQIAARDVNYRTPRRERLLRRRSGRGQSETEAIVGFGASATHS
jgi:hypothetical protein